MTRTLHPATLRAVTKIAQEHGLPLVKAEWNHIIVGEINLVRDSLAWWFSAIWHEKSRQFRCYDIDSSERRFHACGTLRRISFGSMHRHTSAPAALRAALKAMP